MVIHIRTILDTEEDIFRDIEIQDSSTFEEFHFAILDSFGWDANQMAAFYESNEDWDKGDEIPLMDVTEEFGPEKRKTMSEVNLKDVILKPGQKLIYVFDFMLMWCFYIDVVSIIDEQENIAYPRLLLSFGDAPSQTEKEENLDFSEKKSEEDEDEEDDSEFNFDDLISY